MDFENFFKARLDQLHAEGRYRVFANIAAAAPLRPAQNRPVSRPIAAQPNS